MNKFLKEFKDRGFFYQCTNEAELSNLMDSEKIKAYIGFDCTAESLHVGSLLQIMCLRLLQKNGHRPIVLLGGGTTRIGDPSGKDKTRKILSEEEIEKNIKNIDDLQIHKGFNNYYIQIVDALFSKIDLIYNLIKYRVENLNKHIKNTICNRIKNLLEENENLRDINIFDNPLQKCEDSERIHFYHGMIDREEINKTVSYIEQKSK